MWFVLEATIFVGSRDQNDRLPDAISQKFCDSQPSKAIFSFQTKSIHVILKALSTVKKKTINIFYLI